MNIAFFLTPKKDVVFLKTTMTIRKALDVIDAHSFNEMPVINSEGEYWGTLSQGDILHFIRGNPDPRRLLRFRIKDLQPRMLIKPVRINCNIEDLIMVSIGQNFVPVIDDNDKFIGIIKRSAIITYCYQRLFKKSMIEA
ncbi:MAG: CBS domain-containing protein [Clostridia bacterium]|nr:CBS domain-containing protein [Clostridia bacterium]MDR3643602.1 CBS domain-containing protein [Clostridia bacterium]